MSVEDRWYKSKEYHALTKAQKSGLYHKRLERGEVSNRGEHGKKKGKGGKGTGNQPPSKKVRFDLNKKQIKSIAREIASIAQEDKGDSNNNGGNDSNNAGNDNDTGNGTGGNRTNSALRRRNQNGNGSGTP